MKTYISFFLLLFAICTHSCTDDEVIRYKDVKITNTEIYELDLQLSGEDEGARITEQAKHYEISGFLRNAETNYNIYYRYKAEEGYTGEDRVEIETCTGGGGIRCKNLETLIIKFDIVEEETEDI